tara:strand:+ start:51 stop:539 length:489 start_codon:yes stop_codon:yes gene_type:complete
MKKLLIAVIIVAFASSFIESGNIGKILPKTSMKTLEGNVFKISTKNKPVIISFWSTTCVPCIKELNAINSKYDAWKKEVSFELYAVSTDDVRFASRVPLIVNKKEWKFPVLTDQEKATFKALGVNNNPYTIVVDKTGKIVYEHTSYKEGDEDELINIVKGLK